MNLFRRSISLFLGILVLGNGYSLLVGNGVLSYFNAYCVLLILTVLLFSKIYPLPRTKIHTLNRRFLFRLLILSSCASLLYMFLYVGINAEVDNLLDMPQHLAYKRYTNQIKTPWYLGVLNAIGYTYIPFTWLRYSKSNFKNAIRYFPILISLTFSLLVSGKGGIMFSFLLLFAGYKETPVQRLKAWRVGILLLIGFVFLLLAQSGRRGSIEANVIVEVVHRLVGYGFLPILALNSWLREQWILYEFTYGIKSFGGLLDLFGFIDRPDGIYTDITYINDSLRTNIYTAFRSRISDFGFIGSILFTGLHIVAFESYRLLSFGQFRLAFRLLGIVWLYWSLFGTIASYNTYALTFIIILLINKCIVTKELQSS